MFATLLGALPRPPVPGDAPAREVVRAAVEAQVAAGLEPVTDGGLWGSDGDPAERWRATAELTDRAVKAVVTGPFSATEAAPRDTAARAAASDRLNASLRALAAAGCPLVEIHEPAATGIGSDEAARAAFVDAQRRALDGVTGIHRSLAIVGGSADAAGIHTILGAPYDSLALDLVAGPDNWRLAATAPRATGIICGALGTGERADESVEVLLFALGYAASTGGRGRARVGVATAGGLDHLPWELALRRMRLLEEAVRLSAASPDERAAALDPRAISIRSAALGRAGVRTTRAATPPAPTGSHVEGATLRPAHPPEETT